MLGPQEVGEGYSQASSSSGMADREMTFARSCPIFPFIGYRTPSSTTVMSILHEGETGRECQMVVAQFDHFRVSGSPSKCEAAPFHEA
jgi:hypothetical protein